MNIRCFRCFHFNRKEHEIQRGGEEEMSSLSQFSHFFRPLSHHCSLSLHFFFESQQREGKGRNDYQIPSKNRANSVWRD